MNPENPTLENTTPPTPTPAEPNTPKPEPKKSNPEPQSEAPKPEVPEPEPQPVDKKVAKNPKKPASSKSWITFLVIGIITFLGGIAAVLYVFLKPAEEIAELEFPTIPSKVQEEKTYSKLTGLELSDASLIDAPVYCIQTPNGTDGARPQAGLNEAGVVFEAIAEAGITRFAAIYQNATSTVIGPIRSLRLYYLQWDVPFDCTIVHAGGAYDALEAVKSYKHQSESYTYMYRGSVSSRRWNNLFTTPASLAQISSDRGWNSSNIKSFTRNTPAEAEKSRIDAQTTAKLEITTATTENLSSLTPSVNNITFRFGNMANYNPVYKYNATTNTYDRSYTSGKAHEIYSCPAENLSKQDPEKVCTLTQLSPAVVIAMRVQEKKASDNYHEAITTTGTGEAYVFQNGTAIKGTWSKPSINDQIKFLDDNGNEIVLNPGQTFISAIPQYGAVEY